MRRDLWMILILGCLLILLLEAPAALASVSAELDGPYSPGRAERGLRSAALLERGQERITRERMIQPALAEQAGHRGLGT